eukprot:TRINITY_DN7227_c0_g2_i1.p1 TRINITY_DN7227_c0_g2~~TRINITY_DN7227_c0_g2_i1.p1  ORF type:complete len:199 (+),score=31.89 TRINITY_DN7227_c0_g2_i1:51-599(+)
MCIRDRRRVHGIKMSINLQKFCSNPNHTDELVSFICAEPKFQNNRLCCLRCITEEYPEFSGKMLNIKDILKDQIPKNWPLCSEAKELYNKIKHLNESVHTTELSEETIKLKNETQDYFEKILNELDTFIEGARNEVEPLFKEKDSIVQVTELTKQMKSKVEETFYTKQLSCLLYTSPSPRDS